MNVLIFLIPIALALSISGLIGFIYAARSGQMDNLDSPPLKALIDETEKKGIK